MAQGYSAPAYRDFLTCLLPDPTGTATLCQILEDTLFGAHVDDSNDSSDNASGFPDSSQDSDSDTDPFEVQPSPKFAPSRFIWRL